MATCTGTAEQETLKLSFSYLVNSIDTASLLPAALSRQLITERQRVECFSEPDPYQKAEKFLGHLQRAVNGDSEKFHIFLQLLNDSGQESIASNLKIQEHFTRSTLAANANNSEDNSRSTMDQVDIPDALSKELADLRFAYAKLLRSYKKELRRSPEAQEEFVEFLPRLLRSNFSSDQTFQLLFDKLIEKEVSLFNIHYLKNLCDIFPEDVCAATKKLVDQYEQQCQHFMTGTTVSQFKKLFPASATPYKLSAGKVPVKLKLPDLWGENTLYDVRHLIIKLGVPLHLFNIEHGCIAVFCWCSIADVKDLKINVNSGEVADLLQTKGVLQVFIREELMLQCSQPEPAAVSQAHNPVILHLLSETDIDYQCPICTEPLTQPLLTDCGHLLCSNCQDRLLSINETKCPTCREPDALKHARLNKYHQRMVSSLKVRCQYYEEGCKWEGEIRDLQNHLDPENGNCDIECFFGCGKHVRRVKMKEHKKHHCRKRPTTCEYCGYHNTHDIITENHYPVCLQFPIDCPNNCTVKGLERCQLQQHLNECPLQLVECPTGCSVQLPCREMAAHTLQQHNQVLEQIINQVVAITPPPATVSPQYLYNLPPVVFTITDYQEKKQANKVWTSPPYYTHTRGYKFCLKVYPNGNGSGKGTHISVYAYLMRGEYDNELEWPFEGDISVEVCNWKEDKNHILKTILLNRYTDEDGTKTSRVMDKDTGKGYGCHTFISHINLTYNTMTNTEYLHDDSLQVRVSDVVAYSTTTLLHKTPSWQDPLTTTQSVCEFTLTEFSKRKQFNNQYHSPPFYTHPQGYKLCLKVYANGYGSGEGTHVSIFATLIRGEHDQHLQWPFTGDIIFELLNWREDKKHHKRSLEIDENDGFVQVTKQTHGNTMGYDQFISHSYLPYNSTTSTEYLQEDCLRLRVSDVIFYSNALLHKTPSWQDPLTTTQSVCEFTFTEFSKRRQLNNLYYSPPFYTHPQGYKMCLKVYANGYGSGVGTHVSIVATLMRGEHDHHLQWPLTGDITFELLNWREDKNHHKMKAKIVESHGFVQVIKRRFGNSKGYHQFISHSSLPYNSTTNTEYLQEDCLQLRVNVANVN